MKVPGTVNELLTASDVKKLVDDFIAEDMPDATGVVLIWTNSKKDILLRTNLSDINCWGIMAMALRAQEK